MGKDNQDILKKQEALVKEATKYVKPFRKDLKEYEDFYNNKQWPNGQKRPSRNEIFKIIESEVPILTDSMPGTDVIAEQEGRELDAKLLEAAIHNVYDYNDIDLLQSQAVRDALIAWPSWMYPDYDADASDGDGEVVIKLLPWRQVFVDPTATTIDTANHAHMKIPLKVDEIKRRYPEKAKDIKPQRINLSDDGSIENRNQSESFDSNFFGGEDADENKYALENMAILEESWMRDYTKVPIPEEETLNELSLENQELMSGVNPKAKKYEDHEMHMQSHQLQLIGIAGQALQIPPDQVTPEHIELLKEDEMLGLLVLIHQDHQRVHEILFEDNPEPLMPKYKNNWRVLMRVGKVVLYDGPPKVDDGMIPLVPIYAYKDNTWHGFGEIKNIIELQKTLNENRYSILQGLRLMSNGIWIRDEDCGVPAEQIKNEPGAVYTKKRGTELKREMGVPITGDLFRQVELDADIMEEVSGLNEATQGVSPGANASGKHVRILRDQAVGRIRLKSRHLIGSMKRLGWLVAARIIKYYPAEKMLRVKSDSGAISFQKFDPDRLHDLKYFVNIVPGTTAGIDKEVIEAKAKAMLDNQQITLKEYLKISTLPFKDNLLQAIEEREQTEAAAQQLEQDNLVLRAKLDPESLSVEEVKMIEELQLQERNNNLLSLTQGEASGI